MSPRFLERKEKLTLNPGLGLNPKSVPLRNQSVIHLIFEKGLLPTVLNLEQIGSPMELYNNPANQFVAGFLGAPSMNFIAADKITPGDLRTIGIRPEDLTISSDGPLSGQVTHVEHLGGDTNVIVTLEDQPMTLRLFGQHGVKIGETVSLAFDPAKTYLFDQNGQRVT